MTQRLLVGLLALGAVLCAQRRVDPRNTYSRAICVVPMTGCGTPANPRRPQHAPWSPSRKPSPTGIIAFSHVVSDDGRFAPVEFVAHDWAAFQALFTDKSIKFFEKGKDKKDDIEKELKKYKKDFDLEKFGMVMP
ncbi:MAG: hypothetical protein LAP87_07525 [Acidobacteriia bacterium]|nr:hypothetical protein [Terriglobia bacterium]